MLVVEQLQPIIEGLLLAAGRPLTETQLLELFEEGDKPTLDDLLQALYCIKTSCSARGFELVNIASGYQFQVKKQYVKWLLNLLKEKPVKYSRALFETLALIAYRQPITRREIETIRGVSVSASILRTLDVRSWIRIVGCRDVPGKPALYATSKGFLDYFGLKNLGELPVLPEVLNLNESTNIASKLEETDE